MQPEPTWISAWTALAAVATALAAVIVGPIVSLFVARSQNRIALEVAELEFKASVISVSRQNWINDLREAISEFLGALARIGNPSGTRVSAVGQTDPEEGHVERVIVLRSRIALLINPLEEDHRNLLRLIDFAVSLAPSKHDPELTRTVAGVHHDITGEAQQILKREWEQVKREPLGLVKKPV